MVRPCVHREIERTRALVGTQKATATATPKALGKGKLKPFLRIYGEVSPTIALTPPTSLEIGDSILAACWVSQRGDSSVSTEKQLQSKTPPMEAGWPGHASP